MKNEFTNKNGVHVYAEYNSGQSRFGDFAVDYELVRIYNILPDGGEVEIELYAEAVPTYGNESFEELNEKIAEQAEVMGIDLDRYNPVFG